MKSFPKYSLRRPNSMLSFVLAAMLTLVLSACSSSPQNLILGKWEVEGAPMKMTAEFSKDGTAKLTMLGQTLHGRYKVTADNELEWTLNGRTTRNKVSVTDTELEVTNDTNQTIKYKRK